jgi:hypothetical protein
MLSISNLQSYMTSSDIVQLSLQQEILIAIPGFCLTDMKEKWKLENLIGRVKYCKGSTFKLELNVGVWYHNAEVFGPFHNTT